MIIKPFTKKITGRMTPTDFGNINESDVAFHLKRAFKDSKDVYVLNDVQIKHDSENAQIDHLVIYPQGFIVVESKSIYGEVRVNDYGEWSRSVRGKWFGIKSPVIQAELQIEILKRFLSDNVEKFLEKMFSIQKKGIKNWKYDILCAVSCNAIVERDSISEEQNKLIIKADSVAKTVKSIIDGNKPTIRKFLSEDIILTFKRSEIEKLIKILSEIDELKNQTLIERTKEEKGLNTGLFLKLQCHSCKSEKQPINPGKYGYYIACRQCGKNTSISRLKITCLKCNSANTKVHKKNESFFLKCSDCGEKSLIGSNRPSK